MKSEGGRRCPCREDPTARKRESARQRVSRYARRCDAAAEIGDTASEDHYDRLLRTALTDLEQTGGPTSPENTTWQPSRADEFTLDKTAGWSWDQLSEALNQVWDDPAAVDQLMFVVDTKQANEERLQQAEREQHELAMRQADPWATADQALTNPAQRPHKRLSRREQARAEYETYLDCQYLQAEGDCNGVLLNQEGKAARVDPRTLFQGPLPRATKYASEELLSWWGRYGRLNFAAFKFQMLGEDSDRASADRVRRETFDMAPAWGGN